MGWFLTKKDIEAVEARVAALETLLKGIERTSSPDGVPGWYLPGRLGIQTVWNNLQPMGDGAALSVSTAVDKVACLIQHDGAEGKDGLGKDAPSDRIALKVLNTDPHADGQGMNRGLVVITSNAPTNLAIDARSAYNTATDTVTVIEPSEWKG